MDEQDFESSSSAIPTSRLLKDITILTKNVSHCNRFFNFCVNLYIFLLFFSPTGQRAARKLSTVPSGLLPLWHLKQNSDFCLPSGGTDGCL